MCWHGSADSVLLHGAIRQKHASRVTTLVLLYAAKWVRGSLCTPLHFHGLAWDRSAPVSQDVDAIDMVELEPPLLADLLIEQGARLDPAVSTASPFASADDHQRWADSISAATEHSEPNSNPARSWVGMHRCLRVCGQRPVLQALQPTSASEARTAASSHGIIGAEQTHQATGICGPAVVPLPALAIGIVAALSDHDAPAAERPTSLMPAIDGLSSAASGCVADRAAPY